MTTAHHFIPEKIISSSSIAASSSSTTRSSQQQHHSANRPPPVVHRRLDLAAPSNLTPPPEEQHDENTSNVNSQQQQTQIHDDNNRNSDITGYPNDKEIQEKNGDEEENSNINNNNNGSMICSFFSNFCSCSCECNCGCCCDENNSGSKKSSSSSVSQFEIAKKYFVAFYIPNIATAIGTALFATMIPVSMRDFHESDSMTGLIVALSGVGRVIADVPASLLSHKLGPLLTMTLSVLLAGLVFALPVIDYRVWAFIVAQAIVGLPLGAFAVPRLELLQFCLPTAERNKITSHMGAGARFAFLVGPLIGGWVYNDIGGRWSYLFACAFFAVGLAALVFSRDLSDMSKSMMKEAEKQHGRAAGGGEHIISYNVIENQRKKEKEREERRKLKKMASKNSNSKMASSLLSPSSARNRIIDHPSSTPNAAAAENESANTSHNPIHSNQELENEQEVKDETPNISCMDQEEPEKEEHHVDDHKGNLSKQSLPQQTNKTSLSASSLTSSSSDGHTIGTDTDQQSIASHPAMNATFLLDGEEDEEAEEENDYEGEEYKEQDQDCGGDKIETDESSQHVSARSNSESNKNNNNNSKSNSQSGQTSPRLSSRQHSSRRQNNKSPAVPPISLPGSPTMSQRLGGSASVTSPFALAASYNTNENMISEHLLGTTSSNDASGLLLPRNILQQHQCYHNTTNNNNNNLGDDDDTNDEHNNTTSSANIDAFDHHYQKQSSLLIDRPSESTSLLHHPNDSTIINEEQAKKKSSSSSSSIFWTSLKKHWADVILIGVMALSTTALRQGRRLVLTFRALNLSYSAKEVGLVMALSFSIDTLFFWISPMITNKFGYRAAVIPLQIFYAAAFVILSFDASYTDNTTLLVACVVFGIGDIMGAGLMLSIISEQVPRPLVGLARMFVDVGLMGGSIVTGVMSHQINLSWCCRILAMWSGFAVVWAWVVLPADAGKEIVKWMKQRSGGAR